MRKVLALAGSLTVAVGLVAPANAGTQTKDYNGTFEPGGTLSFTVKPTDNGKKVVKFKFFNFPVQCTTGPETTSGNLKFAIKVENKAFEARAQSTSPGAESKLALTGKLKGGGQAVGTLKVKGENVLINDPPDTREDCSSPHTDWTASTVN